MQETVHLDVIGDGPAKRDLVRLVERLGLGARVRFRGWLDQGALAVELPRYRGLVFPSLKEANGIAMQEAMKPGMIS